MVFASEILLPGESFWIEESDLFLLTNRVQFAGNVRSKKLVCCKVEKWYTNGETVYASCSYQHSSFCFKLPDLDDRFSQADDRFVFGSLTIKTDPT